MYQSFLQGSSLIIDQLQEAQVSAEQTHLHPLGKNGKGRQEGCVSHEEAARS